LAWTASWRCPRRAARSARRPSAGLTLGFLGRGDLRQQLIDRPSGDGAAELRHRRVDDLRAPLGHVGDERGMPSRHRFRDLGEG